MATRLAVIAGSYLWLLKGLSRVRGNSHARFLGGRRLVTVVAYPILIHYPPHLGFTSTATPALPFTKKNWNLTLDAGAGEALIGAWKYGRQGIGDPIQFVAHGGVSVHLPGNLVASYQFHHMSDANIYGASRGVDFHMIEFSDYFGNE